MDLKKNKILYFVLGGIVILFILGVFRNISNHNDKLMLVVNEKILEAATRCYHEDKCKNNITLKELYEKEYLEVLVNPLTKADMDETICITYKDLNAKFCE